MTWQEWTIIAITSFTAMLGVLLTVATLPGTWLILLSAIGCQLWQPGTFDWWTIGSLATMATVAEILEFFSGAAGAKSTGGGKHGAIGGVVGALVGALGFTFLIPIPIVGTVIGAVAGAGVGAAVAEKKFGNRTKEEALKIGAGAAAGRLVAIFIKGGFAAAMAVTAIVATCVK
ncbi:MAG: DUF456 family protein [Planctomycetes bacterium]|nr:DUF456 family protein [Planctomycetota bacterium]